MKNAILLFAIAFLLVQCCPRKDIAIRWQEESLQFVTSGVYARIKSVGERHALVYNVESFYTAYGDVGTAGIYIATEEDSYKKALTLTYKILDKLSSSPISERALATARRQLLGQMAIASENELNQLISLGKIYMGRGRCDSYEEMRKKIESITTDDIMRVAREVYNPDNITMLTFKSDKK